jgi:hypothetical protein
VSPLVPICGLCTLQGLCILCDLCDLCEPCPVPAARDEDARRSGLSFASVPELIGEAGCDAVLILTPTAGELS